MKLEYYLRNTWAHGVETVCASSEAGTSSVEPTSTGSHQSFGVLHTKMMVSKPRSLLISKNFLTYELFKEPLRISGALGVVSSVRRVVNGELRKKLF